MKNSCFVYKVGDEHHYCVMVNDCQFVVMFSTIGEHFGISVHSSEELVELFNETRYKNIEDFINDLKIPKYKKVLL